MIFFMIIIVINYSDTLSYEGKVRQLQIESLKAT
jgi:hypothetical protein